MRYIIALLEKFLDFCAKASLACLSRKRTCPAASGLRTAAVSAENQFYYVRLVFAVFSVDISLLFLGFFPAPNLNPTYVVLA